MSKTDMQKAIAQRLGNRGIEMSKQISSGSLFSSPTYDTRRAYSDDDVNELTKQGFLLTEDTGLWLWNAFRQYDPPKRKRPTDV